MTAPGETLRQARKWRKKLRKYRSWVIPGLLLAMLAGFGIYGLVKVTRQRAAAGAAAKRALRLADGRPVTEEIEPNNEFRLANTIALDSSVRGDISPDSDVDTYRFQAPPEPRDLVSVTAINRYPSLALVLEIYDSGGQILSWKRDANPGEDASCVISPQPGQSYSIQVRSRNGTYGPYSVEVKARKAFDENEPNDNIMQSTMTGIGTPRNANIMDARDTDFYQFIAPRTGKVTVSIVNRSTTLVPGLSVYSPEKRFREFGPDVRRPGENLTHAFDVQEGQIYFIQVWSRSDSFGAYTVSVR